MDTVTQMLFGGAVAQAGFRKRLGRRASAAGAVLGLVPDLDVVTGWFTDDVTHGWLYHRGATHSIPVALVYGAALGWAIWWLERRRRGSDPTAEETARRSAWMWLGALCCATHALIDLFTAYGTQLLAPFMDARFAIHAMPIIDPLYSLPLLLAFIIGLTRRSSPHRAARWAQAAIIWVSLYTLMAWGIGLQTETRARAQLARDGIEARGAAISAYPTLLQPFWRRVVVDLPDGFLTGYASPWMATGRSAGSVSARRCPPRRCRQRRTAGPGGCLAGLPWGACTGPCWPTAIPPIPAAMSSRPATIATVHPAPRPVSGGCVSGSMRKTG